MKNFSEFGVQTLEYSCEVRIISYRASDTEFVSYRIVKGSMRIQNQYTAMRY